MVYPFLIRVGVSIGILGTGGGLVGSFQYKIMSSSPGGVAELANVPNEKQRSKAKRKCFIIKAF